MEFPAPFDQFELSFSTFPSSPQPLAPFLSCHSPAPLLGDGEYDLNKASAIGGSDSHFSLTIGEEDPKNSTKAQACDFLGCDYRANTKRDVKRHYSHRHTRGPEKAQFFCHKSGCPRVSKGWPRKDLRDRHVRTVHAKDSAISSPQGLHGDAGPHDDAELQVPPTDDPVNEESALSRPREDLIAELKREVARRMVVEAQLDELRTKFEKMRSKVMIAVAAAE